MKYVNQINFALAAIAAVAVVYALSQTYFSPSEAPRVAVQTPAQPLSPDAIPEAEAERNPVQEAPRAAQPRSLTAPGTPNARPRSTATPAQPEIGRSVPRPNPVPARPSRAAEDQAQAQPQGSDQQAPAPPPAPTDRRGVSGARRPAAPQPDEDEDPGSPRDFSQTPEGARRDQNRRGNPSPPPARSSMPEQRPR